jgi:hypothetical protein
VSRRAIAVVLLLLLSACSKSATTTASDLPTGSPGPKGDLSQAQLHDLLLSKDDLPGTSSRREFAGPELTTQPTPQLALCRGQQAQQPHQLASVIAKPTKPGDVQTFELVAAFPATAGASDAFDSAVADARACASYKVEGAAFTVEDLKPVNVPSPARAMQYRLMTKDVLGRDTRTLVQSGRFFVLISGFGLAPEGQTLLAYQAGIAAKAVARLH